MTPAFVWSHLDHSSDYLFAEYPFLMFEILATYFAAGLLFYDPFCVFFFLNLSLHRTTCGKDQTY